MQVVWSEPAEQDLDAIVEYIAKDNLQAALDMDSLLRKAADSLILFPEKENPDAFQAPENLLPTSTIPWSMSLFLTPFKS